MAALGENRARLRAALDDAAVKQRYIEKGDAILAQGIFGSPQMPFRGEFFGARSTQGRAGEGGVTSRPVGRSVLRVITYDRGAILPSPRNISRRMAHTARALIGW
jgi:hypothetical protein